MSDIEVHPDDEVTIVFRKIKRDGRTTVKRLETVPVPPPDGEKVQYFDIQTSVVFEGNIKIRIISEQARLGEILQWEDKQWVDRTLCCVNVGRRYKLIVGVTDHLSFFAIR